MKFATIASLCMLCGRLAGSVASTICDAVFENNIYHPTIQYGFASTIDDAAKFCSYKSNPGFYSLKDPDATEVATLTKAGLVAIDKGPGKLFKFIMETIAVQDKPYILSFLVELDYYKAHGFDIRKPAPAGGEEVVVTNEEILTMIAILGLDPNCATGKLRVFGVSRTNKKVNKITEMSSYHELFGALSSAMTSRATQMLSALQGAIRSSPCRQAVNITSNDAPVKMKNIGYLAKGYNIYYGNPFSTQAGVDPGFVHYAGREIFEQTYADKKVTGDGRYLLPDGFGATPDAGCSLSFASSTTFKSSEYTDQLKTSVKADFSGWGASFSASTDYTSFHSRTTSSKQRLVSSTAKCAAYSATVNAYKKPKQTADFLQGLKGLPTEYGDGEKYFDFMDNFGTHAVTAAVLGSRFGFTSYFTDEEWKTVEKTGVDVAVAASYEGIVKAGGSLNVSSQKTAQQSFDSSKEGFSLISLGAAPTKGDPIAWAQQVIAEPMPIAYTVQPLCEIINVAGSKSNKKHLEAVKANCVRAQAAEEYCTKRLLARKGLSGCHAATDPTCLWDNDCGIGLTCLKGQCESPKYTNVGEGMCMHGTVYFRVAQISNFTASCAEACTQVSSCVGYAIDTTDRCSLNLDAKLEGTHPPKLPPVAASKGVWGPWISPTDGGWSASGMVTGASVAVHKGWEGWHCYVKIPPQTVAKGEVVLV